MAALRRFPKSRDKSTAQTTGGLEKFMEKSRLSWPSKPKSNQAKVGLLKAIKDKEVFQ